MRKIVYCILAAIMVLSLIDLIPSIMHSQIVQAAVQDVVLDISDAKARPGEEFTVGVSIANNSGLAFLNFTIQYDHEKLSLTGYSDSGWKGWTVGIGKGEKAVWASEDISDFNGEILILKFKVLQSAQEGTTEIILGDPSAYDVDNDFRITANTATISIFSRLPGDVNDDGKLDGRDLVRMKQYFTGYNVKINELNADVDNNGNVDGRDVIRICQYFAGYEVVIGPEGGPQHTHVLTENASVVATCTKSGNIAYWYCTGCKKYYADANTTHEIILSDTVLEAKGHTPVVDLAVPATSDSTGLTEGSHCGVCGVVLKDQTEIPKLKGNEYSITYIIGNNDKYLMGLDIDNPNPSVYSENNGIELDDLFVEGYNFKGWFTSQVDGTGTQVVSIPKGSTGNKKLYAHWEKVRYTVTFDSPDIPFPNTTYTVDEGLTLTNPSWFGYTFVGWSIDGKLVSKIPVGTTGNITLHANWTSNRNMARAVTDLKNPDIIEDVDNGRFIFIYEIGTIENVPLAVNEYFGNSEGINITKNITVNKTVSETNTEGMLEAVSNATTRTSSWTLSEDWNESTKAVNESERSYGMENEKIDSEGNVVAGKYYVSNCSGGATSTSLSSGGSTSNSSKVTKGRSVGIQTKYGRENQTERSIDIEVKEEREVNLKKKLGVFGGLSSTAGLGAAISDCISAGVQLSSYAGITGEKEISARYAKTKSEDELNVVRENSSAELALSGNYNIGTEISETSEGHWDSSKTESSSWNTSKGYESSKETSKNTSISNKISELVNNRYSYSSTIERGGNNSNTVSNGESAEQNNEYSTTVEYSTEHQDSVTKEITFKASPTGYYRSVTAGTLHVFGVVGYDIANNAYYTYTYSVLDKERHEYIDYSMVTANFDDCENGVLPFEIPYDVKEYISVKIGRSDGLVINEETGLVTNYKGESAYVIVPEYISASDGLNSAKAVRVKGISETAFSGEYKDKIVGVFLPDHIHEIPSGAFKGCSKLETVIGYGITSIGDESFSGCTSLDSFIIDGYVNHLGNNAFKDAFKDASKSTTGLYSGLYVEATSPDVADAAINSGAKNLILNLTFMKGDFANRKIVFGDDTQFFAMLGKGDTYSNVSIDTKSKEFFLSNVSFEGNKDTPLTISSDTVILSRVTILDSPGFSMILKSPNTKVGLYGNNYLSSVGENALISKNVEVSLLKNDVDGNLQFDGNYLIYGDITNNDKLNLNHTKGKLIKIDEDAYNSYLTSITVTFDANEGKVNEPSKSVCYGQTYGTLPEPSRVNYVFTGWYTEKVGGTKITENSKVEALANQTLYAHWAKRRVTLTFNPNGGTVSPPSKMLSYGDTYGDMPTPKLDNYKFGGWFTAASGGSQVSELTKVRSSSNITIYAHWTPNPVTLTYNPNGGKVSPSRKTLSYGDSYGTMPEPERENYKFEGWFTSASGGSAVNAQTKVTSSDDITIYAQWTIKPLSDWTLESKVPSGAKIEQEKWKYTKTSYTESTNSSMSGWTSNGNYWKQTGSGSKNYASFPSGFDKGHKIYTEFMKKPYDAYDKGSTKRVVSNKWAGYVYWHWMYDTDHANGHSERAIDNCKGTGQTYDFYYKYFGAFTSTKGGYKSDTYYCQGKGILNYIIPEKTSWNECQGATRWFRFDYNLSTYTDYQKIYKYKKVENLESSTLVSPSDSISNVQRWVKYRER